MKCIGVLTKSNAGRYATRSTLQTTNFLSSAALAMAERLTLTGLVPHVLKYTQRSHAVGRGARRRCSRSTCAAAAR